MLIHFRFSALVVVAALCLTAGCSSPDAGQTEVKFDPVKNAQAEQKSVEDVMNNPHIPEAQKQMIRSRIQNKGSMGEAAAKSGAGKAPAGQ